jgi:hypothetical protein
MDTETLSAFPQEEKTKGLRQEGLATQALTRQLETLEAQPFEKMAVSKAKAWA